MLSYQDLLDAYEWVSADPTLQNAAFINRTSGTVYWATDDLDVGDDLPEDIEDGSKYIAVPNKRDLDLGRSLVFEFVESHLPVDFENVSLLFKRPGAYSKFKELLQHRQLLEAWYEFERAKTFNALRQWANDTGMPNQFATDANAA